MNFKKINLITGWAAFAIATIVYFLTMEPTASLWDCAEFISTSYKLEVGHPPGAPLFMMIARFFTMFAPSPEQVGLMVNAMSSICGGFTILFLCWSIIHLGRRIYERDGKELSQGQIWALMGAGLIGSLAYCFTDTQWFSAVEGEVYSMSSMFTALVFWCILQWENVADEPHSNRWLVLIAYLMGLSIGIHILNLLCIPALVFIYYFRKNPEVTWKGVVKATLAAVLILGTINFIVIPYSVSIGAWFDRMFVNGLGLPVNSGMTFFVFALFALCTWAIWYTYRRGKVVLNTIILCTTVILLGYGSYASVVIRASANPPMNSNDPSDPYALLNLLNRGQYGGSVPILYGPYYSSVPYENTFDRGYYLGDDGKYKEYEYVSGYKYPDDMKFFFPRMYSWDERHIEGYKSWGNVTGTTRYIGEQEVVLPTFGENMRYFFSYQLNFMYWRYFLWNFVGRQSDIQSTGEITNGNWMSGIKFIDGLYLGPQDDIPSEMADNKGRNKYYFLPFILGIIGLIYQLNRDKRNFAVVMWLFVMMGIALVIYFNTTPGEPRERDYVYAGSFYAFCIWIGLGVMWLRDFIVRVAKKDNVAAAAIATAVCAVVPVILVAQNWDDHDRSHRYVVPDIGFNYLESTLPNSIIMNFGDNDTFPLWYNQEVESVRLDVKIMNMSYLGADWYIEQMRIRSNESDPVPFSLPRSKYVKNINDRVPVSEVFNRPVDIKDVIDFVKSDDPRSKVAYQSGETVDYIPAKQLAIPVNKGNVLASGIVAEKDAHLIEDTVYISIGRDYVSKDELMLLDLLASFDWERPLYFTQVYTLESFGLMNYLQFDGYAYRLVPIRTPSSTRNSGYGYEIGRIDTEYLYTKLMEQFRYGNVQDPRVYCDYFVQTNFNASNARGAFARLAKTLVMEGDTARAVEVLDAGIEKMPFEQIRHTQRLSTSLVEAYYLAGAYDKGNAVLEDYARILQEYVEYYLRFTGTKSYLIEDDLYLKVYMLDNLYYLASQFRQNKQAQAIEDFLDSYGLLVE